MSVENCSVGEGTSAEFLKLCEYPEWLNETNVQKVLRKFNLDEKLEVKSFRVQRCGQGESFMSAMYRVGVSFCSGKEPDRLQSRSMIIKALPQNQASADNLGEGSYNVQGKEMEMYDKVLPEFRRLLESINVSGNFYPVVLEVGKRFKVIVMEDLSERHFIMADRFKGLELDHLKLTLQKLAGMHAASAVELAMDSEAFDHIDVGIFTRKIDGFHGYFESMFDAFVAEVATWEGIESYITKLKRLRSTFVENTLKAFDREDGDFLVLNHGDLWVNNLMFKYDGNGSLSDSVLIDFQLCFVGSPALDLIYLLMTSAIVEFRYEMFEELVQFYYYELNDLLTRLGYDRKKIPALHAFQLQVQRKFFWAFTCSALMLPVQLCVEKDVDFEKLLYGDATFKQKLFRNPKYQERIKKILPKLYAMGIFDEM